MSPPPRAIRLALRARANLRDVAAAREASARHQESLAADAARRSGEDLDDALDAARDQLAATSGVAELIRIASELEADRAAAIDAERIRQAAASARQRAEQELQLRARQLRTVEHALDRCLAEHADGATRAEQRLTDDLGARRRGP